MCVIIVKNNRKKLKSEILKKAAFINPHGLGIVWLDKYEITYHKSSEYNVLAKTTRPFIAHFRFATIGKIGKSNTHPFQCGAKPHEYLMMNGTIRGLGDINTSDSKALAQNLGGIARNKWKAELEQYTCRFVTVNTRSKTFQIYNKDLWTQHDGVWYSKDNVLEHHLVAVYGTLKKGYSNYWHYLESSSYWGSGVTKDKYPLLVKGLPYLIDNKGVGHNVEVDVFSVSDSTLAQLDRLEGHPHWYRRQQIKVVLNGNAYREVTCWIYFNLRERDGHEKQEFHKSYRQEFRSSRWYNEDWFGWDSGSKSFKKTKDICTDDSCSLPQGKANPTYFEDTFIDACEWSADRVQFPVEEPEFDISKEKPLCINCYHDLESDNYGSYYCAGCNDWFSENEVNKIKDKQLNF